MLQCVAAEKRARPVECLLLGVFFLCSSVMQCVAVCYSVLQCVEMCRCVLQRVAVCCCVLQCVGV